MLDRFSSLDQSALFGRYRSEGPALLGLGNVEEMLIELLGDRTFEDLPCPFALTSVDLITGQPVILRQGRLVDAAMAAIAIPGVFPSRKWGDFELTDGGLINPVPVDLARSLAPDLPVVAVVLTQQPDSGQDQEDIGGYHPLPVLQRLSRWRLAQAFNNFIRSVEISSRLLAELRLEIDDPEVIIRPDVSHIGLLDWVEVHEVVKLGEQAAEAAMLEIQSATSRFGRLYRRLGLDRFLARGQ
jgi:NTE family protein